jgi:spore maturation protein CgeB
MGLLQDLRSRLGEQRIRVLIVGNVSQKPYSNNLVPIVAAFGEAADVRVVEPMDIPGFTPTGGASPARVPEAALEQLEAGWSPELVVCLAGGLFLDDEARRNLPSDALVIGLALSDPLGLDASLAICSSFDLFYSQDPNSIEIYQQHGLEARVVLPAVDPQRYRPVVAEPDCDVIFIGKWTEQRDRRARKLSQFCEVKVHTSAPLGRWSVPALPPVNEPEDLARALCGARVALEVALVEQEGNPLHGSHRITNRPQFAASVGIPSLIEEFDELPRFFEPGREIVTYSDLRELESRTRWLLANPGEGRRIGRRARRRLFDEHTWHHRVRMILDDAATFRSEHRDGQIIS